MNMNREIKPTFEYADDPADPENWELGTEYKEETYENPAYDPEKYAYISVSAPDSCYFKYLTRKVPSGRTQRRAKMAVVECSWCTIETRYRKPDGEPTSCPRCHHGVHDVPGRAELLRRRLHSWWVDYKYRVKQSWRVLRGTVTYRDEDDE